jgi:hypothetical protein
MTDRERPADSWTNAGASLPVFIGFLVGGVALLWHVVSLAWLRAPGWKNKAEARAELQRVVAEHEGKDYAFWAGHIGQKKLLEFTAQSGIWYQGSIEPFWDDKPGGAIRVLFELDDGGIGAYHPMTSSLLLEQRPASELK